jgi:putative flippase GtrA
VNNFIKFIFNSVVLTLSGFFVRFLANYLVDSKSLNLNISYVIASVIGIIIYMSVYFLFNKISSNDKKKN